MREQRQYTETLPLTVEIIIIIEKNRVDKICSWRERVLRKAKGWQSGTGKVKLQF